MSPRRELPTPAEVERALRAFHPNRSARTRTLARTPWTGFAPALNTTASPMPHMWQHQRGLSPSPRFQRTTRSALSDRTPGLGLLGGQGFAPTSLRRTGQATLMASGSTGRHRSGWYTPSCEGVSASLAKLVRPGLPGDAARLDGVSYVVRRRRPRGQGLVHSTVAYSGKEGQRATGRRLQARRCGLGP